MMGWSGFAFGLLGSLHCLGMCGPLALAIPVPPGTNRLTAVLLYNSGRITTYTFLGLCIGALGQIIAISGFQQLLSVLCGSFLLLMAFSGLKSGAFLRGAVSRITSKIKKAFHLLLRKHGIVSYVLLGAVNGLLPCGLVGLALAAAMATGSLLSGAGYMALFGVGTAPAMIAAATSPHLLRLPKNLNIRALVPVLVLISGILLILRGLNLGIPYVSPKVQATGTRACCHSKLKCH